MSEISGLRSEIPDELLVCPVCLFADAAVAGTCRRGHDEIEMVRVIPLSVWEETARSALGWRKRYENLTDLKSLVAPGQKDGAS